MSSLGACAGSYFGDKDRKTLLLDTVTSSDCIYVNMNWLILGWVPFTAK